jgi:IS30 family transposase
VLDVNWIGTSREIEREREREGRRRARIAVKQEAGERVATRPSLKKSVELAAVVEHVNC